MAKKKVINCNRAVKHVFTEEEINNKSRLMVEAMAEQTRLENELKARAAEYKAEIQAQQSTIDTLAADIRQGHMMVNRECELRKNFDDHIREYWFNGEIIDTEPFTKEDYQLELYGVEDFNQKESDRIDELENGKVIPLDQENTSENLVDGPHSISDSENDLIETHEVESLTDEKPKRKSKKNK